MDGIVRNISSIFLEKGFGRDFWRRSRILTDRGRGLSVRDDSLGDLGAVDVDRVVFVEVFKTASFRSCWTRSRANSLEVFWPSIRLRFCVVRGSLWLEGGFSNDDFEFEERLFKRFFLNS